MESSLSNNPAKKAPEWPFDQGEAVAAITTRQVVREGLPVLQVSHYAHDHSWAFTCGTTNNEADALVLSMKEIIDSDSSLLSIADLPPGWIAWRNSVGAPWQRQLDSEP